MKKSFFFFNQILASRLVSAFWRGKREPSHNEAIESIKKTLAESKLKFNHIFESNMMGFLFSDAEGQIFSANDYFLNLVKYSREDLLAGKLNWKKLTPPEFEGRGRVALIEGLGSGFVAPFEKEYIRSDGQRVSVLVGATRVGQRNFIGFVVDITERKLHERELAEARSMLEERVAIRTQQLQKLNEDLKKAVEDREKESERSKQAQQFLDSVIENIPHMIFVKDAKELRYVRINRASERLLGHPQEEIIGKSDYDLLSKAEADLFAKKDRAVFAQGSAVDIPEEPLNLNGEVRYLHTKKIPIVNASHEPEYLLTISEDVTQQKQIEQQRIALIREQASSEKLKFLARVSAALTQSLDTKKMLTSFADVVVPDFADWCVIDVLNDMGEDESSVVKHRDPEKMKLLSELKEKYPIDWHRDSSITRALQLGISKMITDCTDEHLRSGCRSEDQFKLAKSIGIKSVIIVPIKNYGKIIGAITLISTTRSYTDIHLSIAEDLARRTFYSLENARLYTRAQEANRAKSAFLANMSHEIRTPLGAMLGFAELMLQNSNLPSDQSEFANTIRRNGQQLLRIVDEILDISKVESERIFIEKVPFALAPLIKDVTSLLQAQIEEKPIELIVSVQSKLPDRIITDPTRLRQILINVIGNAIKFTERGKIEVKVELIRNSQETLKITVVDTGIGITEEQARRLFQPFSQADSSMTRRFGGTGLGLFLSKKLAQLLGGDLVLAESVPGQGSRFVMTIEIVSQYGSGFEVAPLVSEAVPFRAKGRILVVDDSADNRALIHHFIARIGGLEVDEAETGAEGVRKVLQNSYNLVLMDIQMPGMDGYEAVKTLRTKNYNELIIALTAHAMKGDKEHCLSSGFDDYLCKPINLKEFQSCLAKHASSDRWNRTGKLAFNHPPN